MAEITLTAEVGRGTGTGPAKRLRAAGRIPGIVYGRGSDPVSISVDWRELRNALSTEQGLNALINLQIDGERQLSIVKELQRHPVRRSVLHVDFLLIDRNKPIDVEVPIVLEGEASQVLDERGIVEQMLNALPIRVRPDAIPAHISVDVTELVIGAVITVGELELPEGVATDLDPERPVVSAQITRAEPEPEVEGEEGEAAEGEAPEGAEGEAGEGAGGGEGGGAADAAGDEG